MYNCIFTSHCTEQTCDKSCPILAETSYLLERNNIQMNNPVFQASDENVAQALDALHRFKGNTGGVVVSSGALSTVQVADLITYCAICENWKGSGLHCTVYNLRYAKYLDEMKQSWGMKSELESFEYMKIWAESAKVLIVSNFDFVNFKDFEAQTLLNLIQLRSSSEYTTILVSPPTKALLHNKGIFINMIISKWLYGNEANKLLFKDGGDHS